MNTNKHYERLSEYKGNFSPDWEIDYNYAAGEVSFNCPCGVKNIFIGEGGEIVKCECGRVYRLVHYVEIADEGEY